MKRSLIFVGIIAIAALFMGCAATVTSPVTGVIYTDVKAPFAVTSNSASSKVGTSTAKSILGAFAFGDASIESASIQGGIKSIHHVDYQSFQVLGMFASFTVYVYGE
jgi:hypothetical protein